MFVNYAHRGASQYAPDSTISSFDLGIAMHANGIETDIQLTRDGIPVLYHNDSLNGRSSGTGTVSEHYLSQLKEMDFGAWKDEKFKGEKILTLEEFAERYFSLDLTFALELKKLGTARPTLEIIKKYGAENKVFISSFFIELLAEVRYLNDSIRISWLMNKPNEDAYKRFKELNGSQICPQAKFIDKALVDEINANGFRVRGWGVTDDELMKKLYALDTDGFTVNFPDKLYALMNK